MMRLVASAIMVLSAIPWATPGLAQAPGDRDFWWHPGGGWGHMMFGGLMMIVFWGGIVLLIVVLVRWLGGGAPSVQAPLPPRKTPLEILQERFARGEIDKEEYEERKRLLSD